MRQKLVNLALEKVDSKILESMELKIPGESILKSTLSGIDPYPYCLQCVGRESRNSARSTSQVRVPILQIKDKVRSKN